MKKIPVLVVLILPFIASCSQSESINKNINNRWYTQNQVDEGKKIFVNNCAECHGKSGEGITADWRKKQKDGSYPPPPLDNSAHAWHHPLKLLKLTVNVGGTQIGGKMPAFKDKLSNQQIESAVAYFQNFWNDDIYSRWKKRGGLK
ncbi:MAG: cytochrome c [Gammaproteobacteria bacterium]|nr:MAG: cytochrome c [Gammaproteobacteria bacterium]